MNKFNNEVSKVMNLGLSKAHACCYVANYYDEYICHIHNKGCKYINECKEAYEKINDGMNIVSIDFANGSSISFEPTCGLRSKIKGIDIL